MASTPTMHNNVVEVAFLLLSQSQENFPGQNVAIISKRFAQVDQDKNKIELAEHPLDSAFLLLVFGKLAEHADRAMRNAQLQVIFSMFTVVLTSV